MGAQKSAPTKVWESGNSLVAVIPKKFAEILELKPGDKIWISVEKVD